MTALDGAPIRAQLTDREAAIATLFGEVRGENDLGRLGVMAVIRHRVLHPGWWGHTLRGVCLQPWQFSCWWAPDQDLDATYAFAQRVLSAPTITQDSMYLSLAAIVDRVMSPSFSDADDPTDGAGSYVTNAFFALPRFTQQFPGARVTAVLGNQTFFSI